jgi:hypothetical protein
VLAEWAALQAVSRAVDTRSLVRLWMVSDAAGAVCIFRACIGRSVLARRAARRTATLVDPVCALRPGVVSTASLVYFQTLTTLMPERRPCVWGLVPCAARPPRSLSVSLRVSVTVCTLVHVWCSRLEHTQSHETQTTEINVRERDTHTT